MNDPLMAPAEHCYCKILIHKYTLTTSNLKIEEYIWNVKYTRKQTPTLDLEIPAIFHRTILILLPKSWQLFRTQTRLKF